MSLTKNNSKKLKGLSPISTNTRAEQVEEHLRGYFKKMELKPGDGIPNELDLSKALGVSRNVIREALSRLRMLGIVDSRKKRGMIIGSPDILSGMERTLQPNLLEKEIIQDLFELRMVLEIGLAYIIFKRKNDLYIKKLEEILKEEAKATTLKEFMKTDIKFHATLYEMSGNGTIKRFQAMLVPVFQYGSKLSSTGALPKPSMPHRTLVDILKNGTADEFSAAMKKHFEIHLDKVR